MNDDVNKSHEARNCLLDFGFLCKTYEAKIKIVENCIDDCVFQHNANGSKQALGLADGRLNKKKKSKLSLSSRYQKR